MQWKLRERNRVGDRIAIDGPFQLRTHRFVHRPEYEIVGGAGADLIRGLIEVTARRF